MRRERGDYPFQQSCRARPQHPGKRRRLQDQQEGETWLALFLLARNQALQERAVLFRHLPQRIVWHEVTLERINRRMEV